MKKLLVVLFALGLVFAFAMPAAATDVKVSGSYFIQGNFQDNPNKLDESVAASSSSQWSGQRLRTQVEFQVQKGLTLVTRFDIQERYWGQGNDAALDEPAGISETNIEFDRVYIVANIGPGVLTAGEQADDIGYRLGVNTTDVPGIRYQVPFGKFTGELIWVKVTEGDRGPDVAAQDTNRYAANLTYKLDKGLVGAYYIYDVNQATATQDTLMNNIRPYGKYVFGPVTVQGELSYQWGSTEYDSGAADLDYKGLSYWVNAYGKIGGTTVGVDYWFVDGDDINDAENTAGTPLGLINPSGSLIMFNYYNDKWNGADTAYKWGSGYGKTNVQIIDVYAKYTVTPKLSLGAYYFIATAPEKTAAGSAGSLDSDYGSEFDLTATYKIYDNLSYMVGFGYLWTGDYWKTATTDKLDNDYLITNQLTLVF